MTEVVKNQNDTELPFHYSHYIYCPLWEKGINIVFDPLKVAVYSHSAPDLAAGTGKLKMTAPPYIIFVIVVISGGFGATSSYFTLHFLIIIEGVKEREKSDFSKFIKLLY